MAETQRLVIRKQSRFFDTASDSGSEREEVLAAAAAPPPVRVLFKKPSATAVKHRRRGARRPLLTENLNSTRSSGRARLAALRAAVAVEAPRFEGAVLLDDARSVITLSDESSDSDSGAVSGSKRLCYVKNGIVRNSHSSPSASSYQVYDGLHVRVCALLHPAPLEKIFSGSKHARSSRKYRSSSKRIGIRVSLELEAHVKGLDPLRGRVVDEWKSVFEAVRPSGGDSSASSMKSDRRPRKMHRFTRALLNFMETRGVTLVAAELPIRDEESNIATRVDLIGLRASDNALILVELKTGFDNGAYTSSDVMRAPLSDVNDSLRNRALLQLAIERAILLKTYGIAVNEAWLVIVNATKQKDGKRTKLSPKMASAGERGLLALRDAWAARRAAASARKNDISLAQNLMADIFGL